MCPKEKDEWTAQKVEDGEWYLVEPTAVESSYEMFNMCTEHLNKEEFRAGKKCLKRLLDISSTNIEALNYLATIYEGEGKRGRATDMWAKAVDIGRNALPADFKEGDEIPWGFTENRPFLRALQCLGLAYLESGNMDKALSIFEENLSYNPNDNQGIRDLLAKVYLDKGRLADVIQLREMFSDDAMPATSYGNALALFKKGEKEKATEELGKAVEDLPKVAEELLKDEHEEPERIMQGTVSFGGWDQAYDHWEMFGEYWGEEELGWLEDVLNEVKGE